MEGFWRTLLLVAVRYHALHTFHYNYVSHLKMTSLVMRTCLSLSHYYWWQRIITHCARCFPLSFFLADSLLGPSLHDLSLFNF